MQNWSGFLEDLKKNKTIWGSGIKFYDLLPEPDINPGSEDEKNTIHCWRLAGAFYF